MVPKSLMIEFTHVLNYVKKNDTQKQFQRRHARPDVSVVVWDVMSERDINADEPPPTLRWKHTFSVAVCGTSAFLFMRSCHQNFPLTKDFPKFWIVQLVSMQKSPWAGRMKIPTFMKIKLEEDVFQLQMFEKKKNHLSIVQFFATIFVKLQGSPQLQEHREQTPLTSLYKFLLDKWCTNFRPFHCTVKCSFFVA